jgi:hypothetical protein
MAARILKMSTFASTLVAIVVHKQNTSHADNKQPNTSQALFTLHLDQIGQKVKKIEEGDGNVIIDGDIGHPESLRTLLKVSENTNQYGLAAIKEFSAAQKAAAEAAKEVAKIHKEEVQWAAEAAAGGQKAAAEAAAGAAKEVAKIHKEEVQWVAEAAARGQKAAAEAAKEVAKIHKEEVLWLSAILGGTGLVMVFVLKGIGESFRSAAETKK